MKKVYPGYYGRFRCIAGECRHSCCIGWEIDMDPDTLAYYRTVPGEFGKRLQNSITVQEDAVHFTLDKAERCPFLNRDGLCDIILTLGEDRLCQICRDHPRFRNVFSDRVETGLGLCCEAACRLILTEREPMTLTESDGTWEKRTAEETFFLDWRGQIFAIVQNRGKTVDERMEDLLTFCQIRLPEKTSAEWAQVYRELTILEDTWLKCLDALAENQGTAAWYTPEWETVWEQLVVYFLYRHLLGGMEDGSLPERAAFAVLSFRMIRNICAAVSPDANLETLLETARLYSAEVEYAEENTAALFDLLYDENYF